MRYLRSLNAAICFSTFGIGSLFIVGIILPFLYLIIRGRKRRRRVFVRCIQKSWVFFVWMMELFRLIRVQMDREGRQKLRDIRSTIVVANHPSLIDVVILVSLVRDPVCIVKGKLTRNFFMKYIILYAYINNESEGKELVEQSKEALSDGYNLIVFPEGTRSMPGVEMKLQRGTAYIAMETGADILPLKIRL